GPWLLQMESNPANVNRAASATLADIRDMQRTGPLPDEIKLFKNWVAGNQALRLETDAGVADILMQSEFYGLGMDYMWRYPRIIRAISAAQIRDAAIRLLHPENVVVSIAGPYPPAHT
nr:insulinase family protein [Armatimonadota bacterium]